jgi:cytochrome c-type biogenesis protein
VRFTGKALRAIIYGMMPLFAVQSGLTNTLDHNPIVALATLFGAGVLTSLTPCVYPMIPITIGVIAGTEGDNASRWRTVRLTLTYIGGLALLYALMGLLAGLSGSLFGTVAANPWARFVIGNILLVFALAMLEVIPVKVPARLSTFVGGLKGGSYSAVFVLGATSGIVAAPCGAPAFAVVLTWVATTQSAVLGFLYLFVFSLGMTVLLAAVGIFSGVLVLLPKSGTWMVWVKRAAGIIMLGMAEYYFVQMGMVF